jgi:hypothetical protein
VCTRNSFGAVSSVMLLVSGMKAAERESPFQMVLTTQATDLRNLLAVDARRREVLVLCIAVSASDEDGVVRSADDPHRQKEIERANYNHVAINCLKQSTRKPNIGYFHAGRVSWLCEKAATA